MRRNADDALFATWHGYVFRPAEPAEQYLVTKGLKHRKEELVKELVFAFCTKEQRHTKQFGTQSSYSFAHLCVFARKDSNRLKRHNLCGDIVSFGGQFITQFLVKQAHAAWLGMVYAGKELPFHF